MSRRSSGEQGNSLAKVRILNSPASGRDTVVEGDNGDLLKTSLDVGKAKLLLGKGLAEARGVLQVV